MITIVITAFKEPKTIGKAIESFLKQKIKSKYELLVLAPDRETGEIVKRYSNKYKQVHYVKDPGKGKPAALNIAFKKAKGDILILSDGDVRVSGSSVNELLSIFSDKNIGGASGRVISTNSSDSMFGYWAFLLSESFHNLRLLENKRNNNTICSGYLYAIRKGIVSSIPEDMLADDAFISLSINKAGYKTIYVPGAKVYVKYPDNLPDWIRQKKRTAGRFYQLKKLGLLKSKTRGLIEEVEAFVRSSNLIREPKQILWIFLLAIMRFYIWFRIFFDFRLWARTFKKTWERVESTK